MTDTFTQLRGIVCRELRIDADRVTHEATFADMHADSLDRIHLTACIEEHFNIEVSDDVVETIETIGDTVAVIERQVAKEKEEYCHD